MFKYIIIFIFIYWNALAANCNRNEHELKNKFKVICTLSYQGEIVEFIYGQKACEFPVGNMVDCAYAVTCFEGQKSRRSSLVFRADSNPGDFCLTAKDVGNKKVRILIQSRSKKNIALLNCPVDQKLEIELSSEEKTTHCAFSFDD